MEQAALAVAAAEQRREEQAVVVVELSQGVGLVPWMEHACVGSIDQATAPVSGDTALEGSHTAALAVAYRSGDHIRCSMASYCQSGGREAGRACRQQSNVDVPFQDAVPVDGRRSQHRPCFDSEKTDWHGGWVRKGSPGSRTDHSAYEPAPYPCQCRKAPVGSRTSCSERSPKSRWVGYVTIGCDVRDAGHGGNPDNRLVGTPARLCRRAVADDDAYCVRSVLSNSLPSEGL